jgi:hypothetical protein
MEGISRKLYPERASENISSEIENLSKIISGEIPAWNISDQERAEVLEAESKLGEKLESIYAITPQSASFYLNYFLTQEGAEDFKNVTGIELPSDIREYADLEKFIYEHSSQLEAIGSKALEPLGGRSDKHHREEISKALLSSIDENGNIDVSLMPQNESVGLRLTPQLDFEKTKQLRDLKRELKAERKDIEQLRDHSEDYTAVLEGTFELYQRKINTMIASRADVFLTLRRKAELMGEEALTQDEKRALSLDSSSQDIPASLARYDKFIHGTSDEFDEAGWRKQISSKLIALADSQEQAYLSSVIKKEDGIAEKGLDSDLLSEKNIAPEEVERLCSETLAHYDLLSQYPASEYDPKRPGPAQDGKWQVVVKDTYRSLSVHGKQKVIKCPNEPQSITKLLSITIAHEIEGHVIQHENKSKIPLKLFDDIGSDRSAIFAEAGAMSNQDHVTKSAFGYESVSRPHYVRAMVKKLEGGNYADCVEAYYMSSIKPYRLQLEQGIIDESEFKKECATLLKTAVGSAGRLFRGGASKTDSYTHLPESKATVYLEQTQLALALKEHGLPELLNLTGVNAAALEFLLRAKFIDVADIQSPDFYSLQLWEGVKEKYARRGEVSGQ